MSQKAISEHLQVQQTRYQNRPGRKARSLLFDKWMTFSGLGRKHLIKVRGGRLPVGGQPGIPAGPGRGRPPAYGKILPLIKALWLVSEQPCGKRFVTQTHIPSALTHPEQLEEMWMLDGLHPRQARQEVLPVTVVPEGGGFHYQ